MATDNDFSGWDDIPADPTDPSGVDAPAIESSEWREVKSINAEERETEIPNTRPVKRNCMRGRIIA